jgi:hypothetical protein
MMQHPFDGADWRGYQKVIVPSEGEPMQARYSVHHEQPFYICNPLSQTSRLNQETKPDCPLGHFEEEYDWTWTDALVLPLGPIVLAIVQHVEPKTPWHGSTLHRKDNGPLQRVVNDPIRQLPDRSIVTVPVQERPVVASSPKPSIDTISSHFRGPCTGCGVTDTPEWRRGPNGRKELCNACGLRFSRIQKKQPTYSEDGQSPNRKRPHHSDESEDGAYDQASPKSVASSQPPTPHGAMARVSEKSPQEPAPASQILSLRPSPVTMDVPLSNDPYASHSPISANVVSLQHPQLASTMEPPDGYQFYPYQLPPGYQPVHINYQASPNYQYQQAPYYFQQIQQRYPMVYSNSPNIGYPQDMWPSWTSPWTD